MNAYVLEDEKWRVDFFVKIGVPRERIFRDPRGLLDALADRDMTQDGSLVIYLDHDLGLKVYEPYPREVTGMDAVRMLIAQDVRAQYVIHSINPVGSIRMEYELRSAGLSVQRIPINVLMKQHGAEIPLLDDIDTGGDTRDILDCLAS